MRRPHYQTVLGYAGLAAAAAFFLVPLAWIAVTSLKTPDQLFQSPPRWFPDHPTGENYRYLFNRVPVVRYSVNSFEVAGLSTVGQLLSCSLAAYAYARLRFVGRSTLFYVQLATLMIPYQVTMIPVFMLMRLLGWVDTYYPLVVPWCLGGAFGTFLLRQFFLTIPTELDDAAKIDGCGPFAIYRRIYLPLAAPALTALGIFVFMYQWNDLLTPVIYLSTPDKFTLTLGLAFFKGTVVTRWNLIMAGALISAAPILILYLAAQRYFVRGIALTGLKA
ncbi:MAG TPA: carbohydrate ABC transporter permease [bacterium]